MRRDARSVVALILAGGVGSRLGPLTEKRCKPAVPFAGTLRVIDFTLMNCVTSELTEVHVLTRRRAPVLQSHLGGRWRRLLQGRGIRLTSLAPHCPGPEGTYRGTADAVHANLDLIEGRDLDAVLVLSGDHVYHADYRPLIAAHLDGGADVTLLTGEVPAAEAGGFGVLEVSTAGRITRFVEKPACPERFARGGRCAINLGVYCFRPAFLIERLLADATDEESSHDFGKNVLPAALQSGLVLSLPLGAVTPFWMPYWRDVGTIRSLFEGNMDLLGLAAPVDVVDPRSVVGAFQLWAPRIQSAVVRIGGELRSGHNIVSENVRIRSSNLIDCVVSPGVFVEEGAVLEECVLFPGVRIGRGARLRRVIVEEGMSVPAGSEVGLETADPEALTLVHAGCRPAKGRELPRPQTIG